VYIQQHIQFSSIKYIHSDVQLSPSSTARTLAYPQTKTLYSFFRFPIVIIYDLLKRLKWERRSKMAHETIPQCDWMKSQDSKGDYIPKRKKEHWIGQLKTTEKQKGNAKKIKKQLTVQTIPLQEKGEAESIITRKVKQTWWQQTGRPSHRPSSYFPQSLKSNVGAWCLWLIPIILVTQEAENKKIEVWGQPGQISLWDPILKIPGT
jgi:hypothetical protein